MLGLGAGDRAEGGGGGRTTGGSKALAHEIQMTLGGGNSKRGVARNKGAGKTGYLDPAEAQGSEEGRDGGGTKGAMPFRDEFGVADVAN